MCMLCLLLEVMMIRLGDGMMLLIVVSVVM